MRKTTSLIFILLFIFSVFIAPVNALNKNFALGIKTLYILPGLSGQYWFSDNIGSEISIWPYSTSGLSYAWYEANLLIKTASTGFQPVFGLGYMNATMWSSSTSATGSGCMVATIGARLGDENFSFIPALEYYFGSFTAMMPTFSLHWFI